MPKRVMPLTDIQISKAKLKDKNYKLTDGNGLYMIFTTSGGKWWRQDYIFNSVRKTISLGTYPVTTLAEARSKALENKKLIRDNINPSDIKKKVKESKKIKLAEIKFKEEAQIHKVIYEWLNNKSGNLKDVTIKKKTQMLEKRFLPHFSKYNDRGFITSSKPINEISRKDLVEVLKITDNETKDTVDRIFSDCRGIWLYAISKDLVENNIISNISKKDTFSQNPVKHIPKITDENTLKELLCAIDNYQHNTTIKQLLKFVAHIPLRADNLCKLKWEYIDFEKRLLKIPRNDMKIKDENLPPFELPITNQVIKILNDTRSFTNNDLWVFPSPTDPKRHINKETPNKALKIMGFNDESNGRKQTMHSFRGTFRSLVETHQDSHKATFEVKERVLDHQETNISNRAYMHKADYTSQIKPLLEWWSGYLDGLKKN